MRYYSIIALAFVLTGCEAWQSDEEQAAKACESFISDALRSPSTYKRVNATHAPHKTGAAFRYVAISYDADNAFGTPIRGAQVCAFKVDPQTGDYPHGDLMESSARLARAEMRLREAQELAGQKLPTRPIGAFDCCISTEDGTAALETF